MCGIRTLQELGSSLTGSSPALRSLKVELEGRNVLGSEGNGISLTQLFCFSHKTLESIFIDFGNIHRFERDGAEGIDQAMINLKIKAFEVVLSALNGNYPSLKELIVIASFHPFDYSIERSMLWATLPDQQEEGLSFDSVDGLTSTTIRWNVPLSLRCESQST